jgi:polyisoprenoid-binding protein YceI
MTKRMNVNRFLRQPLLLLILFLGFAQAVRPQSSTPKITVHLDPQKTEIHWTLHDVLHTVHGTFRLKGGLMTFDPGTGVAQGEFLVDVSTGESGDETRDAKMQSEVLESKKYPEAFFHPVKVSGTLKQGENQDVTVGGTFNMHGADHPLTLHLAVQLHGADAVATTHFVIPYVAWGMKDESKLLLRVDKEVEVDVTARGTVEGATGTK